MKDLLRAWQYFRPDARRIGGAAVFLILGVGCNVLKPWPLAVIVDVCLRGPGDLSPLPYLTGAIILLYILQAGFSSAQNYLSIQVGLNGLTRVRTELFEWLQRLSLRFHQGARAGDLIYRASWDVYAFQTLFQQGMMTFLTALLSLIVMTSIMAWMNIWLTLVALALAPLLVLGIRSFGGRMRDSTTQAQQADSRAMSLVEQAITSLPLTQSYTREAEEERRFASQAEQTRALRLTQHSWELGYGFVIAVIFALGTAAITWLGAHQVAEHRLTIGELLVFLAYLVQLYEPLNQLSHVGATVAGATAGVRRVFEILDTPEEVKEKPGARPVTLRGAAEISFDNVSFSYEKGREVLRGVSFSLKNGESAAVIGPSGAGKTTLLHLLPRFFDPSSGAIRIDGIDLREMRLHDLRSQVGLVLQEPVLLPGTIAENIACGKPGATSREIEAAARAANAHLFIHALPSQYETRVGDGAARLSVGERQRLNLARAFLKDAPILLLDEPTSALDAESEALIGESLRQLLRGRTVLMVAHRLSTIAALQRVLVLADGRLTENGTPDELRASGGYYALALAGHS